MSNMSTEVLEEGLLLEDLLSGVERTREIILYNDDVNTFDHVIRSLVEVCDHGHIQAEQCAHLVHYTGKCSVKRGTYDQLLPRCTALQERGLSADIE